MFKKVLSLTAVLFVALVTGCTKTNYKPGKNLVLTSIEMCDEYGDSTLIQYEGFDILVDSGSEADAEHVKSVLTDKVADKEIDLLVVTHPHGDHIGGIINGALEGFSVKYIVDYGYTYNTDGHDKITNLEYVQRYVDARKAFVNKGANYHGIKEQIKEEDRMVISKEDDLYLRWLKNDYYYGEDETFPNSSCPSTNPNVTSVSFVLEYKYWNIVMCGDADSTLEEPSISNNHETLFKDKNKRVLLKGTHHCSSSSMGYKFLDWARPEIIFTSSAMVDSICVPNEVKIGSGEGELNHPNKSTVRRIKQRCENFYWNGINGDLVFVTNGVNDMEIAGRGRNKDYYKKGTTEAASRDAERNVTFFNSEFAKYY